MRQYAPKTKKPAVVTPTRELNQQQSASHGSFQFKDKRPETDTIRQLQGMASKHSAQQQIIQKKESKSIPNAKKTPTQLLKKHFLTQDKTAPLVKKYHTTVGKIVGIIESRVDQARNMALNWSAMNTSDRGYLGQWARTAQDYFNNPQEVPDFIHARFGYAIETLACANLPSEADGLSIDFQVAVGSTRPDIVLSNQQGVVVSWLDITSKDSENHILGKAGAGWRNKPFVYEIFYEPLKLPEVLTGLEDPVYKAWGEYLSIKQQIAHEEQEKQRTTLRNQLLKLQEDQAWQTGYGNASTKRQLTKELLLSLKMNLGRSTQKTSRGALAMVDINDGPFGYNKGNIGRDSSAAKRYLKRKAKKATDSRQSEIEQNYLEHYQDMIADHQDLPLVINFYKYLSDGVNSNKIEVGTAVAASVEEYDSLKYAQTQLAKAKDSRAVKLNKKMIPLLQDLPEDADFQVLSSWSKASKSLRKQMESLRLIISEQQPFLNYLRSKYGGMSFFKRTMKETQLVQALSQTPSSLSEAKEIVRVASEHRNGNL